MQGRFHAYEGYSAAEITFPVRVMKALGIELLIVSNAAGGLNPDFAVGDIMVIDDHINFMNRNPLVGVNDDRLGPRFPDMSAPYDRELGDRALAIAREHDFACHRGTYIGVLGPNYETRAEIRMLRNWGDAVGMSTVPEVDRRRPRPPARRSAFRRSPTSARRTSDTKPVAKLWSRQRVPQAFACDRSSKAYVATSTTNGSELPAGLCRLKHKGR